MPTLKTRSAMPAFARGDKAVTAKNRTVVMTSTDSSSISSSPVTTTTFSADAADEEPHAATSSSDSSVSFFSTGDMLLEEQIDELIEFNMVYGHSDVSESMGQIYQFLGQWCDRIRWANKAGLISKGNVQLLQNIGFRWGGESSSSTIVSHVTPPPGKQSTDTKSAPDEAACRSLAVPVPAPEQVVQEPALALARNKETLEPPDAPINPLPGPWCPPMKRTTDTVNRRPTKRERVVDHVFNPSSQYCDPRYLSSRSQQSNQYHQGYYYSSQYYKPWHSQHQYKQPYNSYYQPTNSVASMQANTSYNVFSSTLPSVPNYTSGNSSYSFHYNRQAPPPQKNFKTGITLPMTPARTVIVPASKQEESQSEGKAKALCLPVQLYHHIHPSTRNASPPDKNPAAAAVAAAPKQSFNKTVADSTFSSNSENPDSYLYGDEIQHLVGMKIIDLIPENTKAQVSVYTTLVISQLKILRTDDNPGGIRKCLYSGFPGLQCMHCNVRTQKRSGAYFPTSVKTLADSKKTLFAVDEHLQHKCIHCPQELKNQIASLKASHEFERRAKHKYGGQRAFFFEIWKILHPDKKQASKIVRKKTDETDEKDELNTSR